MHVNALHHNKFLNIPVACLRDTHLVWHPVWAVFPRVAIPCVISSHVAFPRMSFYNDE